MKPLSITLASAAILAAASFGAHAQGQPPLEEQKPGMNKSAPEKGGGAAQGGKSDRAVQPGAEKPGGKEAQSPGPDRGDKAERPGRADSGEKPGGKPDQKNADDKPVGKADQKNAAEKPAEGMNKDGKNADTKDNAGKPDGDRSKAADQGKPGGKPEKQATKEIKPEQKTVIKQTFVRENIRPQHLNVQVRVGVAVPRTVVLYALPPTLIEIYPSYRSYKFVLADDDTILVIDPVTWEIVDVIEV